MLRRQAMRSGNIQTERRAIKLVKKNPKNPKGQKRHLSKSSQSDTEQEPPAEVGVNALTGSSRCSTAATTTKQFVFGADRSRPRSLHFLRADTAATSGGPLAVRLDVSWKRWDAEERWENVQQRLQRNSFPPSARGGPMIHPNDGTHLPPCPPLSPSLSRSPSLSHYEPVDELQGSGVHQLK